jgi:nucleoside-diphosphate-sugar epimerase
VVLARDHKRAESQLGPDVAVIEGDVLDAAACVRAATGCDAVLHLATAIPRGPKPNWSMNDRIRTEGTGNLLAAARSAGARRYVQQSVIFVYNDGGESWLDEESPIDAPSFLRSAVEMEAMVRESADVEWTILRGSLFYGTDTGATEQLLDNVRNGRAMVSASGERYLSLIHPRDMASAVVAAVEKASPGSVYNVVDDEPVRQNDLVRFLAHLLSVAAPCATPESTPTGRSLRVSSARLRHALGWEPGFSTFREGFRAILIGEG